MPALKNENQEKFCNEYLVDFNGSAAAIRAGYSKKSARFQASHLATNPNIIARIKELRDEYWKAMDMDAPEIRARHAAVIRFDVRKLYDKEGHLKPVHELDDLTAMAIDSIEVEERAVKDPDDQDSEVMVLTRTKKLKATNRMAALTNMARMANLFEKDQNAARPDLELLAPFLKAAAEREGTGSFLTGKTEPKP